VTGVTGSCHELADGGTVLIPAFSIGRTQELLYEIEGLIHEFGQTTADKPPVDLHGRLAKCSAGKSSGTLRAAFRVYAYRVFLTT